MNLHTTTLRHRLVPGAAAGLVLASSLALSACGSSSSSSSSPSTSTSVSSASAASAPASSAASPASSDSAATPSASGGTGHHTAAQLSEAVRRATLGGAPLVGVYPGAKAAKEINELGGDRSDMRKAGIFSPVGCKEVVLPVFLGVDGMTPANTAMGNDEKGRLLVIATSAPAPAWPDSTALAGCAHFTEHEKGTDTSQTSVKEVPISTRTATDAHEVRLTMDKDSQPVDVAIARVGDVTLQVTSGNSKRDLGPVMDALAAQVQKLG